jgi:hypothetical protein
VSFQAYKGITKEGIVGFEREEERLEQLKDENSMAFSTLKARYQG